MKEEKRDEFSGFSMQRLQGDRVRHTLQEIYDGFADTYEENRGLFDMTDVFESFFRRLTVEGGRVLDMGCGAGEPFARFFVDHDWSVVGVDFSKRMLELAARYVPQMNTIHADMRDAAFEANQFDAIVAIFSLFHIPRDDHGDLFAGFYRWLRPQGKALFTYATKEYTGSDEFDGYKAFMGQELYYSHTTPDKLYAILKETGFDIESADYRNIGDEVLLWITVSKPAADMA